MYVNKFFIIAAINYEEEEEYYVSLRRLLHKQHAKTARGGGEDYTNMKKMKKGCNVRLERKKSII